MLKNVIDDVAHLFNQFETLKDHVKSVFDVYTALLNIQNNEATHELNFVMQRLTIATSIFLPLTFIVGVYGMNFEFMPELHSKWGYPLVWIIMLTIGVGMFWFF